MISCCQRTNHDKTTKIPELDLIFRASWLSEIEIEKFREPKLHVKVKEKMLGEHGSDLQFPRARAPEYSAERERAYLLSSEWVQELPRCSGRHIRFQAPESNRFDLPPWMIKTSRDLG